MTGRGAPQRREGEGMQRTRFCLSLVVAVAVGLGGFGGFGGAAAHAAPSVMILYFDNDTGDPSFDPLGKGLADMMVTDLAALPGVQIVEREKLQALLDELKLQRTRYFDTATAQKIGRGIGAEYAVTGSLVSAAPDLRIDVRVIRIKSGEVVKADKVIGKKDAFFALEQQLVERLAAGLDAALGRKSATVKSQGGVDNVATAIEYGKALDLRDKGDLAAAAQHMEAAMKVAPGWKLARSRYLEIMKALYAAKDTRSDALTRADEALLAALDARIARNAEKLKKDTGFAINWRMTVPAYALRGELLLRRVAERLDRPAAELRPAVQAYLDNQQRLIEHQLGFQKPGSYAFGYGLCHDPDWRFACLDKKELGWAADLGLADPMPESHMVDAHQLLQDMHAVLMFGESPFYGGIKLARHVCMYKLDASYPALAQRLLDRAIALLGQYTSEYDAGFLEDETISLHVQRAMHHLAFGRREEAIASLQAMLTRYPKAKRFSELEKFLRAILAGETKAPNGRPFVPACVDPS
jgi:TolB-like protein